MYDLPLVGMIDTGLSPADYPEFSGTRMRICSVVGADGSDAIGHGTQVASRILCPQYGGLSGVELISYGAVAAGDRTADPAAVCYAIELAIRDNVKVLNISMGSGRHCDRLERMCFEADRQGVLIVAAWSRFNRYPAEYRSVVGVAGEGIGPVGLLREPDCNLSVCGGQASGSSFAAASITVALLRALIASRTVSSNLRVAIPSLINRDRVLDRVRLTQWAETLS